MLALASLDRTENIGSLNSPEHELLAAVLRHAFLDYLCGAKGAAKWIFDGLDAESPFSFKWCCSYLGISPGALRESLLAKPCSLEEYPRLKRALRRTKLRVVS